MKILNICAYTWAIGGPARIIYDHTAVALSLGHEVTILSPASPQDELYPTPAGAKLVVCYRTAPISRFFNEFSWNLWKYLKAHLHEYDVVHCHGIFHFGSVAPFLLETNTKRVVTIHGLLDRWALRHSYWKKKIFSFVIQKRLLKRADLIHINNRDEQADLEQYLGYAHPNVVIVPNGMNLAELAQLPPKGTFRSQFGIDNEADMVLFMGRLNIKKGLDLLLPAFQKIAQEAPRALLVIAGPDDGYQAQTEQFIKDHQLENRVKLVGMLTGETKKAALADATLFTLPSYSEGFSIAALEAMTAAVPCVVSDRIGFDGYVAQHEAAVEVSLTIDSVYDGLKQVLNDDVVRQKIAQNAKKMVYQRFDIKAVAVKLLDAMSLN